jgi:hypothetical protein
VALRASVYAQVRTLLRQPNDGRPFHKSSANIANASSESTRSRKREWMKLKISSPYAVSTAVAASCMRPESNAARI